MTGTPNEIEDRTPSVDAHTARPPLTPRQADEQIEPSDRPADRMLADARRLSAVQELRALEDVVSGRRR